MPIVILLLATLALGGGVTAQVITRRKNTEAARQLVARFGTLALQTQQKYNLSAIAILAQLAIETGWGKQILHGYLNANIINERIKHARIGGKYVNSNNLFNIKEFREGKPKVWAWVWEHIDGEDVMLWQPFRYYESHAHSFDEYGAFIAGSKRYRKAVGVLDPYRYAYEVFKGGYATDPKYLRKWQSVIKDILSVQIA